MRPLDPLRVPTRGAQLIEASAGTGKTYTITSLYLRLILERELGVDRILVVTFTRAATAELRDRLRSRLRAGVAALASRGGTGDAFLDDYVASRPDPEADRRRLERELRRFDEAAVFTIHGFCQRVLQDHAFESGAQFDARLVTDGAPLLREVAADYWSARVCGAEPAFVAYLREQRFSLSDLLSLGALALADPEREILPARGPHTWPEALARVRQCHGQAAALWATERDPVIARLTAPPLYKNHWSPAKRDARVALLDEILQPDRAVPTALPQTLRMVTPAKLERFTTQTGVTPQHPFFEAWDALWEAVQELADQAAARLLGWKLDYVQWVRAETRRRKQATGTQYYDDLLQRLDEALRSPGGDALAAAVRRRFAAALIDEFQDTDPIQYRIFERLFWHADTTLYLIGDPKQAIYGFRSADIFAYLAAARAAGQDRLTLGTNWRSDPGLVAAVNRVFSRAAAPFLFEEIPFVPVAPRDHAEDALRGEAMDTCPLDLLYLSPAALGGEGPLVPAGVAHREIPEVVASDIARLLSSGTTLQPVPGDPASAAPLTAGHVAVLVRSNQQGAVIQAALRRAGIASVLHGGASVFETAEAGELGTLLWALARPADPMRLRAALATPLVGLGAPSLLALAEDEDAWDDWALRFRTWAEQWERRGFLQAFARLTRELTLERRTLARPGGERRFTNLLHLSELLHLAAKRYHLGPEALARWFSLARQGAGLDGGGDEDARQIRIESDRRAVQVLTMHRCKGLEYPVVYCPYLWGSAQLRQGDLKVVRFHDPGDRWRRKVDLGSPERDAHLSLAQREALAESLRLAYVALTRARHRCTVVWGPVHGVETSALGYLLHQAPGDGEAPDRSAVRARIATLGDAGVRADLEALAASAQGAIQVRDAPTPRAWRAPEDAEPGTRGVPLAARAFRTPVLRTFRSSSFTALVSGSEAALSPAAREGVDRDEPAPPRKADDAPAPPREADDEPAPPREADDATAPIAAPEPSRDVPPVRLADFPRGARVGNFFHQLLETLPFDAGAALRTERAAALLRRYGLDPAQAGRVSEAVGRVLDAPLPTEGSPLRLCALPADARRAELEFTLPVAQAGEAAPILLTASRLADAFARWSTPGAGLRRYAAQLRQVRPPPLEGWLRGFMDLVFRHEGRYYLLDWKTNHLGERPSDYAPARILEQMAAHHYLLQAHLYAVALHHHLQATLPGYRYEAAFGGLCYVFLRGVDPDLPPGSGVWYHRPGFDLITALSDVVRGVAPSPEARP